MFGFDVAYFRLKARKNDRAAIALMIICALLAVLSQPGMFPYILFFTTAVIVADKAFREVPAKLLAFSFILYLLTSFLVYNCGFSMPIIRLFAYNNLFGVPMELFVRIIGTADPSLTNIISGFVSSQSMFMFDNTTPGLFFIICVVYAYTFLFIIKKAAPGAPALPLPIEFKMPRATLLLFALSYAAFRVFSHYPPASLPIKISHLMSLAAAFFITAFAKFLFDLAGVKKQSKLFVGFIFAASLFLILFRITPSKVPYVSATQLVWSSILLLYIIQGMTLAYRAVSGKATLKAFLLLFFMFSFIVHEPLYLFCVLGMLDNLFGLRLFIAEESARVPGNTSAGNPARGFILAMSSVALVIFVIAWILTAHVRSGSGKAPHMFSRFDLPKKITGFSHSETGDEIHVSGPKLSFFIDRYEYPNKAGSTAVNNVTPDRAAEMCAAAGKRLCSPEEWAYSCASGDSNTFYYLDPKKSESYKIVNEACSWRDKITTDYTLKCGQYPKCSNAYNIHDMIGNLWEWVELPDNPSMVGIMGPGERNGCQRCRSCDWTAIFYKDQIKLLPLDKIGFRCCKDAGKR